MLEVIIFDKIRKLAPRSGLKVEEGRSVRPYQVITRHWLAVLWFDNLPPSEGKLEGLVRAGYLRTTITIAWSTPLCGAQQIAATQARAIDKIISQLPAS